jgi:hypothetical protein
MRVASAASPNEATTLPPTDPVAADGFSTGAVRPVVSDAETVTMSGGDLRRRPRLGPVGIGAAVVGVLVAIGVISMRTGHGTAPQSGVVAPTGGVVATVPVPETHAAAVAPEAPAPAVPPAPVTAAAPADTSPPAPARAVASPPKRAAGTAPARPAAPAGAAKPKTAPTDVFSTRE